MFSDEHSHPTVYNNTSFEAMTQPYIVYAVPEDIFFGLQSRKNAYYCPGGWCWLYNNNGLSYIGFRINGSSIFISPEGNWVKALNIGRNVEWLVDILEYPEYFVDIDGIVDEQWIPFENR